MTTPEIISLISTITLTVLIVVLGIQLMFLIADLRRTLKKFNHTLDSAENTMEQINQPISALHALIDGVKQSGKIVELIGSFISKKKSS